MINEKTLRVAIQFRKVAHENALKDPGHANFCKDYPCGDATLIHTGEAMLRVLRLIPKWQEDLTTYPSGDSNAQHAKVAVKLSLQELEAAIEGR